MSTRPVRAEAFSTRAETAEASETSVMEEWTLPPFWGLAASTVCWRASGSISQAQTWAPLAARPWTMARPMPWAAPVTRAVLSVNSMFMGLFLL